MTGLVPGLIAILAMMSALLVMARRRATHPESTIPSHLSGSLPTGPDLINEAGVGLLLRAAELIGSAIDGEQLEAGIRQFAVDWRSHMYAAKTAEAFTRLLADAGALMIRIQTSDLTFQLLAEPTREAVNAWIGEFGEQ